MDYLSRADKIKQLFPHEPAFRLKQIDEALFLPGKKGWEDVQTLPKRMRETLTREVPWLSVKEVKVMESAKKDTFKAVVEVAGGKRIETVLMQNARDQWTVCVSSQVGCAMRCTFCATGKMGLSRSLEADEIVDQIRFWKMYIASSSWHLAVGKLSQPDASSQKPDASRISNIVYMGMGEPLANYENVKNSLNTILTQTDIGPTHITVSTVGVLPRLEQLLTDKEWPHVRLAVSLHSADPITRKEIVPTSHDRFLPTLLDWTKRYLELLGNRRHHLTFEYVMLHGVNDTEHHADALADFVRKVGQVKINLIPYNFTDSEFESTPRDDLQRFMNRLEAQGATVTSRRTMGEDIAAACGQLIVVAN